jgi:hypothetical protein
VRWSGGVVTSRAKESEATIRGTTRVQRHLDDEFLNSAALELVPIPEESPGPFSLPLALDDRRRR